MTTQFFQGESSTSSRWKYDVFLSFRGKDTRKNFTGHLYSRLIQLGIRTFIDDEKLRKGDVISSELEKAIEDSRISIVVFSKNYASSSWCLDELVKILECRDKLKQVVLPIFYDVDPSQVRNQIGYFGKPLARRRKRFGAERMDKWKAALTQAANLSGWDLQNVANGHESRCIDVIIKQVLQKVNQTPLDVAWYPVGIDSRVKDIEPLLQSECADEVRMVGIYGIGGIGKTTLAKAIYNQILRHFDSSCFLSNVRLEDEAFGLVKLQERFLREILKTDDFKVNSVDEGIKLIEERLCSKRVLVILDDLDSRSQLESLARERSWFGSGSLIIITTRDEQLLLGLRANERYKAKLLNDMMAQQLFSCHAFNNILPPQEYVKLAQDIIKYSGGLPLALVTLGSHLRGRSVEEWEYEFAKLKAIPHSDIQKILKISFDSLDDDTQSVFLDIACAFHRFPKKEVTETLNACGYYSESAIATLVRKCLLQSDGYFLRMHDLVRDMGREIVRTESPQNPGKRSRLFIPKEVHDVLQGNKGSEKVEVLMVVIHPRLKGVNLSTKAFETMKNLRVLIMDELHISGDFELLSKELRWLSWQRCPLTYIPSKFPADKLVVLNLRGSNIQEFGLNLQCFKSLKVLDLSFCKDLREIRDFNALPSLEALRLACCSSLTDIDSSIGNLDSLVLLNLFRCHKLTNLPSSICKLKSLQSLNISECSSIQTLPLELGDMLSLQTLLARYTGIKQLPASIEKLIQLVTLEVGGRNLEAKRSLSERTFHLLPAFISRLSLTYCDFSEADIPRDIGSLSSLRYLNLSGNSFQHLPFDFSKLRCLWTLRLNDCENLQTLPSVLNLENLIAFEIANCKKLENVTGLEKLSAIRWINMVNCTSLQNPFNLGFFSALALRKYARQGSGTCLQFDVYEVPNWCNNKVTTSSICFTMPTHNKEYKFLGVILWCVRDFVRVPSSSTTFLSFRIAREMSSIFRWRFDDINADRNAILSSVIYISSLETPFNGQMKGGEKMQVFVEGKENTVKNMGIHLLYVDKHRNVTSFPALMDQMNKSLEINHVASVEHESRYGGARNRAVQSKSKIKSNRQKRWFCFGLI